MATQRFLDARWAEQEGPFGARIAALTACIFLSATLSGCGIAGVCAPFKTRRWTEGEWQAIAFVQPRTDAQRAREQCVESGQQQCVASVWNACQERSNTQLSRGGETQTDKFLDRNCAATFEQVKANVQDRACSSGPGLDRFLTTCMRESGYQWVEVTKTSCYMTIM